MRSTLDFDAGISFHKGLGLGNILLYKNPDGPELGDIAIANTIDDHGF